MSAERPSPPPRRKGLAPQRRIVAVLSPPRGGREIVKFECGHNGWAGRTVKFDECWKCHRAGMEGKL